MEPLSIVWISAWTAFYLGILTSISPCPLATNVAAISYIGRRLSNTRGVFLAGLLYTLGRVAVYLLLGLVLVGSLLSVPATSRFLQEYMQILIGPILIIVAMVLLELIPLNFHPGGISETTQHRIDSWGTWGAFLLGGLFASTFCPTSAMWFFGSLIPLAVRVDSKLLLPICYGAGTGLPVLIFAVLLAVGTRKVGVVFHRLTQIERWARLATSMIFLAMGIHFSLKHLFALTPFWDPWLQSAVDVFVG